MLFVLTTIYDYSAILECYYQNEIIYKIKLTESIIKIHKVDNKIVITVYTESKHKRVQFRISKDNEFLYIPYGGTYKGLTFNELYENLIIYNNVKRSKQQ